MVRLKFMYVVLITNNLITGSDFSMTFNTWVNPIGDIPPVGGLFSVNANYQFRYVYSLGLISSSQGIIFLFKSFDFSNIFFLFVCQDFN